MISYTVLTTTGTRLANKSVPVSAPEYICHLTKPMPLEWKTSQSFSGRGRIDR